MPKKDIRESIIHNQNGTYSYVMRCSIKNATGAFVSKVETLHIPEDIANNKKAVSEFIYTHRIQWKSELKQKLHRALEFTEQRRDMLFVDFAKEYVENILIYNPTAYNHHVASKAHLETVKPLLGKYLLSEMTQSVIQNFCKWLCTRTYKKATITAKPAVLTLIKERHIPLHLIAESCKIANTTPYAALHGKAISKTTAQSICDYLNIPLNRYFIVTEKDTPYSWCANNSVKIFIHGVLHEAVRQGIIEHNYASSEYIRPVTGTRGKKEILETPQEQKEFISCMNKEPDLRKKAAFALLIYTGMRSAELCGLTWENIDLENKTIAVVQNTVYVGKQFGTVTKDPKSAKSKRKIGIPSALVEILTAYKTWWKRAKEIHGDLWANTDKLFVQESGKDMSGGTIANWLKEFERKNGLKNVTPHGLRHSNITLLIASGVDAKTVSARAGHSDVQTTLNIYTHYTKDADRQAADIIDKLLHV